MGKRARRFLSLASVVAAASVAAAWGAFVGACARSSPPGEPSAPGGSIEDKSATPVTVVQVDAPPKPDASQEDAGMVDNPPASEDAAPPPRPKPKPSNDKTLDFLPAE